MFPMLLVHVRFEYGLFAVYFDLAVPEGDLKAFQHTGKLTVAGHELTEEDVTVRLANIILFILRYASNLVFYVVVNHHLLTCLFRLTMHLEIIQRCLKNTKRIQMEKYISTLLSYLLAGTAY